MASVTVWRMSSLENSSRIREPEVSAMTVDTIPVFTTKKTPPARSAATTSIALNVPSLGPPAKSRKTRPLAPIANMYWPRLNAQATRRLLWMRSAIVLATTCVSIAAPTPPNRTSANMKVVEGTSSPSPSPSLTGRTSPTTTAIPRIRIGSSKWVTSSGPRRAKSGTRIAKPTPMTVAM